MVYKEEQMILKVRYLNYHLFFYLWYIYLILIDHGKMRIFEIRKSKGILSRERSKAFITLISIIFENNDTFTIIELEVIDYLRL